MCPFMSMSLRRATCTGPTMSKGSSTSGIFFLASEGKTANLVWGLRHHCVKSITTVRRKYMKAAWKSNRRQPILVYRHAPLHRGLKPLDYGLHRRWQFVQPPRLHVDDHPGAVWT